MTELERLERALRAAHAAGDAAAAQRFAMAIRDLQAASAQPQGMFGGGGEFSDEGEEREWGGPREEGKLAGRESGVLGAAAEGAGSGALGVGTITGAVDEFMRSRAEGKPRSWNESLEFARGQREGAYGEHPYAYAAGNVFGLYASGKGASAALKKAPAIVKSVFQLKDGQTIRNIARLSATGAAAAGTTAGMQEGVDEVPQAAVVGGVLAPAATGLIHGVVGAGRYIGSKIDPTNAAIRILAKRMGESANAVADRYNEFMQTMGRKPRLIEIMQRSAAEEMGQVSASKVGVDAGRVFRSAEEAAANARPGELQQSIQSGGLTTTAVAIARARDKAFKHTMNQIGEHRAPLSSKIRDVIEDSEVQAALPAILRRRINNTIEAGEELGSIDLSVNEFDMMRQAINKKIGSGAGQLYKDYRNKLRDYIVERVPDYGAALDKYGRYSEAMKGAKLGQRVLTGDADQFRDAVEKAAENTGAGTGIAAGVRSKLANKAGESAAAATSTAAALAENPGLHQRLVTALGGSEAARLQRVGATSTRAARNMDAATPIGTDAQRRMQAQAQQIQEIIAGGVLIAGKSSGAFKANIMNNLTQRLRMSRGVAKRLAEIAVDPDNAHVFISRIRDAGVNEAELLQWYRAAAQAAGTLSGAASAEQ